MIHDPRSTCERTTDQLPQECRHPGVPGTWQEERGRYLGSTLTVTPGLANTLKVELKLIPPGLGDLRRSDDSLHDA